MGETGAKDEIRRRFGSLNVFKQGDERAPHKPLLLLLALARIARGGPRLVEYAAVEKQLKDLLMDFGPLRKSYHPHFPFWHLQTDGLWDLQGIADANERAPGDTPRVTQMRDPAVRGGLPEEIDSTVRSDPDLLHDLAHQLLDDSFPESLHEEIARSVGLELTDRTRRVGRPRDPGFRDRILVAYGFSCAVCGYDLRLRHAPVALEAAHIKWHQAGGPATENNGLALCTMHHKLFDRGAMTVDARRHVLVSELVNGSTGLEEWLERFHDRPLREPRSPDYVPLEEYVRWHVLQVFKGEVTSVT